MSEQANQSTKNTVRCGHCGNKTLMQIIAEGKYSKTLVCDPVNAYESWRDYHQDLRNWHRRSLITGTLVL
ncbi:hypothetical protein LC613_33295 [Nostoc sphaeroides CHAB 2801]|uniref:hypothetical protein n=1 Tax=Nostoc sphaeroides TaxID=446679 RepID=UPI001E440DA6|nr:hypothetical protein [Nostoc sphaeroides]MCC5632496.1 hypothetical protein [Nostoc sphaeroides CHAB 2801]